MSADRTIEAVGLIDGTYGRETVRVERMKRGKWAGRYATRGAGFAGRVMYRTIERAKASVEAHALFAGWEAQS